MLRLVATRPAVAVWERTVGIDAREHAFATSPYGRGLDWLLAAVVPLLALLAASIVVRRFRGGERRLAVACAAIGTGSLITTELLKLLLPHRHDIPPRFQGGYPSGHTTVAFATALVLAATLPATRRAIPLALGYAAFVAAGVLVDGWHLPLDALGALGVVAAWTLAVLAVPGAPRLPGVDLREALLAVVATAIGLAVLLTRLGVPAHASFARQTVEAAAIAAAATVGVGLAVSRAGGASGGRSRSSRPRT